MLTSKYKAFPVHDQLGAAFFDPVSPAKFPQSIIRYRNLRWAESIGFDQLNDQEWIEYFAKFKTLPDNFPNPLALRYHGHQFQHYNPDLGDGRGFLYAQVLDPMDSRILDLATKGSGQTPYSRQGDGRLTLKGAVRETLATEWLEALGVNTSKTFSVIETGEDLERHDEPSPTRSAVLVRLSHSHIRFGSFQRFAFLNQLEPLRKLIIHSCKYYFPELLTLTDGNAVNSTLATEFFKQVSTNAANLCAQWMIAGFVHGVLNTDNLVITGESFDYGPFRFLPHFDPMFTAAYFDHAGLYAYGRQPEAVYWNLQQLAHALSFIDEHPEQQLDKYLSFLQPFFSNQINLKMTENFLKRLNLKVEEKSKDQELLRTAYEFLRTSKISFDGFFFDWNGGLLSKEFALNGLRSELYKGKIFDDWVARLGSHSCKNESKLKQLRKDWKNPESLVIDEVEEIWSHIDQTDDWKAFENKIVSFRRWGEWAKL